MNKPSSITFNVGAPTLGVRWLCHYFCGVSHVAHFPFWNDAKAQLRMILKTDSLPKPSSNTLNVGAPTFRPVAHPFRGEVFRSLGEVMPVEGKPSGIKGLSYNPRHCLREAVSQ
jgi:hypothetical protein